MTKTQARIIELFRTLPACEQREVMDRLAATASPSTFLDRMTRDQREALDKSIAEADRNEGIPASEVLDGITRKHGFARSK